VTEGEATLRSPALFIGARRGAADPVLERRGGGGGFFVELLADVEPGEGEPAEAPVCGLSTAFVDPRSDEPIALEHSLSTPLGAGQNPDPAQPFFSDPTRAKPFMMLNMYLALRTALELYEAGDCGAALGVEEMMLQSYLYWSRVYDDNDIDADFELLEDLSTAIDRGCQEPIVHPVHVPYSCFIF
jgi:Ca-activated chloride channel family protein